MNKTFAIILSAILFVSYTKAQEVYFCKTHTQNGKPVDAQIEWTIRPWGETIEILFDNEGKIIKGNHVYLYIDREVNGKYEPFDSKVIEIKRGSTWVSFPFKFVELGKYKVYFLNSKQEILSSENLTLKLEESFSSTSKKISSLFYDRIRLIFCERVIAGKIINEKSYVSMSKNEGQIFVYLIGQTPFNTRKLLVDIWKEKENSYEEQFVESKKFKMKPEWADVFFRYKFKSPGEYKISIYNGDEVLIKSGFIKVVK